MGKSKGAASGGKKSRAALRETTAAGKTARNISAQKRVKATTSSFAPTEDASASALNLPPDTTAASSSVALPQPPVEPASAVSTPAVEVAAAAVVTTAPEAATVAITMVTPPEPEGERRPWSKIPDDQKHLPASSIDKLRASPTLDMTAEVAAASMASEGGHRETAPKVIISRYLAPPPPTELVRIPAALAATQPPTRRRDASAWMPVALLVALVVGLAAWRIVRTPAGIPPVQQAQGLKQNSMTQAPPEVARTNTPAPTVAQGQANVAAPVTAVSAPAPSEPVVAVAPASPEPIAPAPTATEPAHVAEPAVALAPSPATTPTTSTTTTTQTPAPAVSPTPAAVVASAQPAGPMVTSPTVTPPAPATPTKLSMNSNPSRAQKYDSVPPKAAPWHQNVPPLAAAEKAAVAAAPSRTYDEKPPLAAQAKLGAEVVNAEARFKNYDGVPPAAAAAESRPRVLVMSQPPGATVMVGGREVGQTPVTIKLDGPSDVPVVVRHPGYAPETMQLQGLLSKRSVTIVLSPTN